MRGQSSTDTNLDIQVSQRILRELALPTPLASAYERAASVTSLHDLRRWADNPVVSCNTLTQATLLLRSVPLFSGRFLFAVVPDGKWDISFAAAGTDSPVPLDFSARDLGVTIPAAAADVPIPFILASASSVENDPGTIVHEVVHIHQFLMGRHLPARGLRGSSMTTWFKVHAITEAEAELITGLAFRRAEADLGAPLSWLLDELGSLRAAALAAGWLHAFLFAASLDDPLQIEEAFGCILTAIHKHGLSMVKSWQVDPHLAAPVWNPEAALRFAQRQIQDEIPPLDWDSVWARFVGATSLHTVRRSRDV